MITREAWKSSRFAAAMLVALVQAPAAQAQRPSADQPPAVPPAQPAPAPSAATPGAATPGAATPGAAAVPAAASPSAAVAPAAAGGGSGAAGANAAARMPSEREALSPHRRQSRGPSAKVNPALPAGSVEVRLLSSSPELVAGVPVRLKITKLSIEQGNSESERTATADALGVAHFTDQATSSEFQYELIVEQGPAKYTSGKFSFGNTGGVSATIPVYPATDNISQIMALSRMAVVVQPREDVFSIEAYIQVDNFSQTTWVPRDFTLALPAGFKAFTASEEGQAHAEPDGDRGFKLTGSFGPGQSNVAFRFQLPNEGKSTKSISFPTMMNTAFVRILADAAPGMTVDVDGFPAAEETVNKDGQRQLALVRDFLKEKQRAPATVDIRMSGIPTPGPGRNIAAALASMIVLGSVGWTFSGKRRSRSDRSQLSGEDLKQASDLILDELVELELAFESGAVGRKTRDRARQQLLDAFARLGAEQASRPQGATS